MRTGWARRMAVGACCLVAAVGVLGACGNDTDSGSSGATTATGATQAAGGEAGTVDAASLPVYAIVADATTAQGAMSYTLPGGDAPAGTVKVTLRNDDTMMAHQAQLMKLHPGVTPEQFTSALQGPAGIGGVVQMADFAGGPNAVEPGATSTAIVQLDPSATYMVLCQLPGPGGKPHYALGMIGHFSTSATAQEQGWPQAGATVTMSDFRFAEPSSIDWDKPIAVVNDGDQPHEMAVLAPAEGKTMDDVRAALTAPEGGQAGPPPYAVYGGVAAAAPGQTQQTTLDLDPGDYLLVCFVVDPASGKPHYMLGMEQPITVK